MLSPPLEDDLDVEPDASPPTPPGRSRWSRSPVHRRRRRIVAGIAVILAACLIWLAVSLGGALTNPALGSSTSARFAEWAREHGAGSIVNWAENEWYSHHKPKVGGALPKGTIHKAKTVPTTPAVTTVQHLPAPAPIVPIVSPAVSGEGQWSPAGRLVEGVPAVYTTVLRPSAIHTSYVVGIAWMDTTLLKATLYSGSLIPGGGPFSHTAPVSPTDSTSLVAAFNAGFLMDAANGGYYTDGKTVDPAPHGGGVLRDLPERESTVGQWGRDVSMSPDVVSVRQNLDLLVDNGQVVPAAYNSSSLRWGATLGGADYVWRSGMGVTANGAIVYVGGPGLNIVDLANILVKAGAVRAMELDINTDWVNYSTYQPATPTGSATAANGTELLSGMTGTPGRYFQPWWARDFITMSAPTPNGRTPKGR